MRTWVTPVMALALPLLAVVFSPTSLATNVACSVTTPNGSTPPHQVPNTRYHGNGSLWTTLPKDGRIIFSAKELLPDGSFWLKFPWWRGVEGKLAITGLRLDTSAPLLKAAIPDGYGHHGFQASGLTFPTAGCWQITATVGEAPLTFVVLLIKTE